MPGGPIEPRSRRKQVSTGRVPKEKQSDSSREATSKAHQIPAGLEKSTSRNPGTGADYRLLVTLLDQLPLNGKWSQQRRDRWLQAVTANLDLLVEVVPDTSQLALSAETERPEQSSEFDNMPF